MTIENKEMGIRFEVDNQQDFDKWYEIRKEQIRADAEKELQGLKELGKLYSEIRADVIEKYRQEMHDMIDGNEEFTDWQKYEILECNELVAEQLKSQDT